jgi:hypothetical protein
LLVLAEVRETGHDVGIAQVAIETPLGDGRQTVEQTLVHDQFLNFILRLYMGDIYGCKEEVEVDAFLFEFDDGRRGFFDA